MPFFDWSNTWVSLYLLNPQLITTKCCIIIKFGVLKNHGKYFPDIINVLYGSLQINSHITPRTNFFKYLKRVVVLKQQLCIDLELWELIYHEAARLIVLWTPGKDLMCITWSSPSLHILTCSNICPILDVLTYVKQNWK